MRYPNLLNVTLALGALLAVALSLAPGPGALAQQHALPLVTSADSERQGFLRIVNRSSRAGTVRIDAIDDDGQRYGPVNLSLGALGTAHLNSADLEQGNTDKGLSGGVGDGEGSWRLELTSELEIEPLAYIRTPDGFVTSMHDVVQPEIDPETSSLSDDSIRYHVRFLNPGSNNQQQSQLRLVNPSGTEVIVTIDGLDDGGASPPGGDVQVTLPAHAARTITAQQLEQGDTGFEGSFGDGVNKWQLFVSAADSALGQGRPLQVMSLLFSRPTGNLTNLSATGLGNDPNRGGDGTDVIVGGGGDDVLNPGDNNDSFDVVIASAGDDRIVYSDSGPSASQKINYADMNEGISVAIDGTSNTATVDKGSAGTDTIVDVANPLNAASMPPYGAFQIDGSPFDDTFVLTLEDAGPFYGPGQWMNVTGNAGNDHIEIRSGRVELSYDTSTEDVDVDLAAGRANNDGFGGVDTIIGEVFELGGGDGDDTLRGTDGGEQFDGGAGDDVYFPGDNDYRHGRSDQVFASVGNDTIDYTGSGEYAYQAVLYSIPWFESPTPLIDGGVHVKIDGPGKTATVAKGAAGTDTLVNVDNPMRGGGLGIHGTTTDDRFELNLDHGQWMQVEGGPGDDTFDIRTLHWESPERPGSYPRVQYGYSRSGIEIDLQTGIASNDGFGDVDTFDFNGKPVQIQGSDFADKILGSDSGDSFIGRGGDDYIDGRGGDDELRFDRSGVRAVDVDLEEGTATGTWISTRDYPGIDPTGAFSYTFTSIERVRGSLAGDDDLAGSSGDDRLDGKGGDDTLEGREGNDRLIGGDGDDIFRFLPGHGDDRIDDFGNGEDIIVLVGLDIGSKRDVLDHAWAWDEGVGVHIELTSFGGGTINLIGFHRDDFDASDFLL